MIGSSSRKGQDEIGFTVEQDEITSKAQRRKRGGAETTDGNSKTIEMRRERKSGTGGGTCFFAAAREDFRWEYGHPH